MTLRQRDITIEVREIPLPFLRLHVGPDYIGVPKAPGTERDSRPGCRLREMVYVQAEEGKWNGLARRHEPCRARPTLPQLDRDRSQDQQREKAQRRPRRRRHAARPPFEWWRGLRRHFAYNCDYSRSFAAAGRAAAAGCATNDESRRWPGPRSQWPSRSGLTEPSHGLARESRYPDTAVDRSSYERAGQNSPRAKRRHSEDPCGGTLRGRNAGRRSTGRNGAPT